MSIKVKSANETIYFLLAIDPLTFILFLIEFLISKNINTKNISTITMFEIRRISKIFFIKFNEAFIYKS